MKLSTIALLSLITGIFLGVLWMFINANLIVITGSMMGYITYWSLILSNKLDKLEEDRT